MRILPFMLNKTKNQNKPQFVSKNTNANAIKRQPHQYTGVASTDLAYASMFDSQIAKDLKLMGLI